MQGCKWLQVANTIVIKSLYKIVSQHRHMPPWPDCNNSLLDKHYPKTAAIAQTWASIAHDAHTTAQAYDHKSRQQCLSTSVLVARLCPMGCDTPNALGSKQGSTGDNFLHLLQFEVPGLTSFGV